MGFTIAKSTQLWPSNTIVLSREISDDPIVDFSESPNYVAGRFTAGFNRIGFSVGAPIIRGRVIVKWLSKAEADALITFFSQTIKFVAPFYLQSSVYDVDLGNGAGVPLTRCYLPDDVKSTESIIFPEGKGNKWQLNLEYISLDKVTQENSLR